MSRCAGYCSRRFRYAEIEREKERYIEWEIKRAREGEGEHLGDVRRC
jgi:hypothetical protein